MKLKNIKRKWIEYTSIYFYAIQFYRIFSQQSQSEDILQRSTRKKEYFADCLYILIPILVLVIFSAVPILNSSKSSSVLDIYTISKDLYALIITITVIYFSLYKANILKNRFFTKPLNKLYIYSLGSIFAYVTCVWLFSKDLYQSINYVVLILNWFFVLLLPIFVRTLFINYSDYHVIYEDITSTLNQKGDLLFKKMNKWKLYIEKNEREIFDISKSLKNPLLSNSKKQRIELKNNMLLTKRDYLIGKYVTSCILFRNIIETSKYDILSIIQSYTQTIWNNQFSKITLIFDKRLKQWLKNIEDLQKVCYKKSMLNGQIKAFNESIEKLKITEKN